ncbi:CehA/McbA family metallohydrolase [Pedococcus sp. 2YAF34]|uniref:CehA/McbA family metallohydrolase n=1 Tax=Pedococcus sp. 2YAF34 TaxID=3233032 RepID=UPI003F9DCBCE
MTVFAGTWTPAHRAESVWHQLPFDVPSSCAGLRVTLDFDRSHGSAGVLDLGLVDPLGWRGWSGGARSVIALGREGATPGYLDRGLPPGRWEVVLGLHRIPEGGLAYQVTVDTTATVAPEAVDVPRPPVPERRPRRDLPAVEGLRWLAGDCHAHTVHSDGSLSIDELAALAAGRGLDFLWVTDHNTTSHHPHLAEAGAHYGIDLLPGQEVTTADGHANAFGDIGWVDFRQPGGTWAADVQARGGLLSVNHPVSGDCAWRHPSVPGSQPTPASEVWHSSWTDLADGGPLAWWVAAGCPIPLGGSDFHRPEPWVELGRPTTWVACADGDVLGGMLAGRTAVSAGPDAPVLLRVGDELVALEADGAMLVCPGGRRSPVHGDRATFGGHDGAHLLERTDRTVVAIAA